jgi:RimJ/RimL family protein N-acetyltransferase
MTLSDVTQTATVRLEPFGAADWERLAGWTTDEAQLLQWAGSLFHWPLDGAQRDAYLAAATGPRPTRLIWRALETPGGEVVGHVELDAIDRHHLTATLTRVLLSPAHRGHGLGAALTAAVLDRGFHDEGLHRIQLRVFDFNAPAIRCYESLGFRREGLLRETRRIGQTWWSSLVMSLLEDEWRSRKEP